MNTSASKGFSDVPPSVADTSPIMYAKLSHPERRFLDRQYRRALRFCASRNSEEDLRRDLEIVKLAYYRLLATIGICAFALVFVTENLILSHGNDGYYRLIGLVMSPGVIAIVGFVLYRYVIFRRFANGDDDLSVEVRSSMVSDADLSVLLSPSAYFYSHLTDAERYIAMTFLRRDNRRRGGISMSLRAYQAPRRAYRKAYALITLVPLLAVPSALGVVPFPQVEGGPWIRVGISVTFTIIWILLMSLRLRRVDRYIANTPDR